MGRRYDASLLDAMHRNQTAARVGGVDIFLRPVPDDDRAHAMDPRVLADALRKLENAKAGHSHTASLEAMRNRTDKGTEDLTAGSVTRAEELLEVGDRFIPLYVWTPAGHEAGSPALIYMHGGGFTTGDVRQFENQLAFIAERAGAVVFFPEYRLAPETAYPGQIEDCLAAVRHIVERSEEYGFDPSSLLVAGDSAGGSLANACIQQLPAGTFAGAVELYPAVQFCEEDPDWSYDLYPMLEEQREVATSRVNRLRGSDDEIKDLYLHGKTEASDPLVSAVYAPDLSVFPPMTVVTAEFDYLRPADEKWARMLGEHGVDVQVIRYGGCDHGFFDLFGSYPQSEDVCNTIVDRLAAL